MIYKNRKSNYPLYPQFVIDDFRSAVDYATEHFPERTALYYKKHPNDKGIIEEKYPEFRDKIRAVGTELIALGLRDKTVAIIGEVSPEWVYSYYAVMSMGAISVPIDKELPPEDIASILNTAECVGVIYSSSIEKKIAAIKGTVPTLATLISWGDNHVEGTLDYAELLASGARRLAEGDRSFFDYVIDPDRLATIVFTSGTTGKGKGVMLSTRNICKDMEQGIYNFDICNNVMMVLPPHHTFGSTIVLLGHIAEGVGVYLSSGLRYIMAEMKEFQPEEMVLVPLFVETFYKRILATAEKTGQLKKLQKAIKLSNFLRKFGIDLREKMFASVLENFGGKLHMIICGGAALHQDIIDFFESIGVIILNGYGITECAPLISCNRNEYRKTGSVGMPIIGGVVKIDDPDENGEGEICYKGVNVMLGYYKNEEATKAVMDDEGFFHTGDLGKVVMEGDDQWIYITGRRKNLIIFSNGKNVYPEEIETDIQGIYGVGEVVVYAGESKSDPAKEIIVAEIYPDTEALTRHEITDAQSYFEEEIKKINQKNVSYKAVGKVKIRAEEFPKNTSRKILRFKIDKTIE